MGLGNAVVLDYIDMIKSGEISDETINDLIKTAGEVPSTEEDTIRHHDEDFALLTTSKHGSFNRHFLIASKINALVNKHAFLENHAKLPEKAQIIAAGNIKAACERYRLPIGEDLEKLAKDKRHHPGNIYIMTPEDELKQRVKKASSEEGFYAITKNLNGDKFELYSINTERELMEVVSSFDGKAQVSAFPFIQEMATNIEKRAQEIGVEVPTDNLIERINHGVLSPIFSIQMEKRAELCKNEEGKLAYMKLASMTEKNPQALALTVERMDRKYGLSPKWGRNINNHINSCLIEKKAEVIEMNGVELQPERIAQVVRDNKGIFSKLVGKELTTQIIKNPMNSFSSLEPHVKQLILNKVSENA